MNNMEADLSIWGSAACSQDCAEGKGCQCTPRALWFSSQQPARCGGTEWEGLLWFAVTACTQRCRHMHDECNTRWRNPGHVTVMSWWQSGHTWDSLAHLVTRWFKCGLDVHSSPDCLCSVSLFRDREVVRLLSSILSESWFSSDK